MRPVAVDEAKTQLSRLLSLAERGEEVIIARAGEPIAPLVPIGPAPVRREPGGLEGLVVLSEDWDSAATNAEVAELFEATVLLPDAS